MAEERTEGISLPWQGAGDSEGPTGNNHLLVIAIDEYDHCPVLHNCVKDAKGFIEVLSERYDFAEDNILTLYNDETTRANIHSHFKEMKDRVQPQDNLVVYFSGHGETEDNVGYWVPVEAHPEREWEFVSTNDIKSRLDVINSFHTLMIVDACFSGSLFASYRSVKAGYETKRSRLGLAASHSRERAMDGTAGENSPFAERLLKKLWENTGTLSAHKLAAEVIEEVQAVTRGRQTPVFKPLDVKGDDSGQYVFRLKADEASDWTACQKTGTLAAYEAFLAKYPEGEHAGEAQEQVVLLRDEEAWQTVKGEHSISSYLQYRQENPDGRYRMEALEAIKNLEEEQSWTKARRQNTIFVYEQYLEKYPAGRYRQEAEEALQALLSGKPVPKKPAQKPAAKAPPVKEEKPRQEPPKKEKKEAPPQKVGRPETTPEKPAPAASAAPAINKKYLMIGGGVLAVVLLVFIWVISSKGSTSEASVTLELFESGGKYGYRDSAGKEILAAQFEQAEPFREGRARVTLNGQTLTIDETGKCVADCPGAGDNNALASRDEKTENTIATPIPPTDDSPTEKPAGEASKKAEDNSGAAKTAAATLGADGLRFDGKTYRTVRLKGLNWMAQNLDYDVSGSLCYGKDPANCRKYGRLYTWAAAEKACAAMGGGWRLPTAREWRTMAAQYGGADEDASDGGAAAYKALTSGGSGFSAQLGGWRKADGSFGNAGDNGYYWTSTENALGLIALYYFTSGELSSVNNDPRLGFSCRCVK